MNKLNWTKGIDPKTGLPVEYDSSKPLQVYANGTQRRGTGETVNTCPHIQGGVNFWPPAYNTTTGIAYAAGIEACSDLTVKEEKPGENLTFSGDFTWTRIDQKYSGTVVAPTLASVAKPAAVYELKDQDSFNFLLRAQRNF